MVQLHMLLRVLVLALAFVLVLLLVHDIAAVIAVADGAGRDANGDARARRELAIISRPRADEGRMTTMSKVATQPMVMQKKRLPEIATGKVEMQAIVAQRAL
eukprot:5731352-Alexandrium_andersonii.AAC.1